MWSKAAVVTCAVVVVVASLVSVAGVPAATGSPKNGPLVKRATAITGHVYLAGGPAGGQQRNGDPGAQVSVMSLAGARVARTVSTRDGRFRIRVLHGTYYVTAKLGAGAASTDCSRVRVRVRTHHEVDVSVSCSIS